MRTRAILLSTCAIGLFMSQHSCPAQDGMEYWPQWRGPLANGVAPHSDPPTEWSEQQNVKWKVPVPGLGNATPVIWGDKVFVLTAVEAQRGTQPGSEAGEDDTRPAGGAAADPAPAPRGPRATGEPAERGGRRVPPGFGRPGGPGPPGFGRPGGFGQPGFGRASRPSVAHEFQVLCYDRASGKLLWQQTARREIPHEGAFAGHGDYASYSPVTDGERLYAYFGSRGLYCYDLDGNLQWERDLGPLRIAMQFGEGGSPALYGNTLIVNRDHEGDSQLVALDKQTGETLWTVDRDERTTWSTPLVVEHNGQVQVVVNATQRTRSYDIQTGELIWQCGGQTSNVIPSPVAAPGMVLVTSGYRGSSLQAIELGRRGELTGSDAIRWSVNRGTPYVPSPLLYGDKIYVFSGNNGVLSCYQVETGEANFVQERLEGFGNVYASPVGAADRVYLVSRDGVAVVLQRSQDLEVLAVNRLDDGFDASPALVGNELFLRGKQHLYCISRNE